jgi:hypothetical protein
VRSLILPLLLALVPVGGASARVELEAALDASQVSPAPVGTDPQVGGLARLVVEDDGTVRWDLRVFDLTGSATGTHLREGLPGTTGPVIVTLTNPPSTGTHVGTFGPLSSDAQARLFAGAWYASVETAANPGGEIRGQVRLATLEGRTCACAGATTRGFRRCVKAALRRLPRVTRRSAAAALVRRAARRATCGPPPRRVPAGRSACCLPLSPLENIVVERVCAAVSARTCAALGGRQGALPSCLAPGDACPTPLR